MTKTNNFHIHTSMGQIPKNIIFVIPDGAGPSLYAAYRQYKNQGYAAFMNRIIMDDYLLGQVSTSPKNDSSKTFITVTDSAAAGTAFATGQKTYTSAISMDHEGNPIKNMAEYAKEVNKKVGIVVTADVAHATPAVFYAHAANRNEKVHIADQLIDNPASNGELKVDILMGAGTPYFKREDRNLIQEIQQKGYIFVDNKHDLLTSKGAKILGLFADYFLPKYWDMPETIPTLAEMTHYTLERLSTHEEGFFLMVEASQIDRAAHLNSIASAMSEMEDYEAAWNVAIDFAKKDGETLVIAASDHDTGGFSVASKGQETFDVNPLLQMHASPEKIAQELITHQDDEAILKKYIDWDLTPIEIATLSNSRGGMFADPYKETLSNLIQFINWRTNSGWTSFNHTGGDVNLYAYGPGWENFLGFHQNSDIGQILINLIQNKKA